MAEDDKKNPAPQKPIAERKEKPKKEDKKVEKETKKEVLTTNKNLDTLISANVSSAARAEKKADALVKSSEAQKEIERAARQVATVTAIVPIPWIDMLAAFGTNVRMIRRIGEIYGGRSGPIGSWRLLRSVLAHLMATGALAVGDDWLGSVFGGSLLSRLSRRFGEGMVNAALTARVGRAAIDVCRPLPFNMQERPKISVVLLRALTGIFDKTPD